MTFFTYLGPNRNVDFTGIPTAEAFGSPSLNQSIIMTTGIASAEAFGTLSIFNVSTSRRRAAGRYRASYHNTVHR